MLSDQNIILDVPMIIDCGAAVLCVDVGVRHPPNQEGTLPKVRYLTVPLGTIIRYFNKLPSKSGCLARAYVFNALVLFA